MADDPLKNPDRDEKHRRRREAGESGDTPDGKRIAERLYGGPSALEDEEDTEDEPTLFSDEETDMPHANARRSKRHEREIADAAEDAGLNAERAWNSNGRSLGESMECDVRLETPGGTTWTVQAKRRKTIANYLTCENADVVVTRADRESNLVILSLDDFLELISET